MHLDGVRRITTEGRSVLAPAPVTADLFSIVTHLFLAQNQKNAFEVYKKYVADKKLSTLNLTLR